MENLKEYLKENFNVLFDLVCECNGYDGSLEEYYYWYNDEEFFQCFYCNDILELVRAICYGNYNYCDDYVKINVYGNLESVDEYELKNILNDNVDEILDTFLELYKNDNVDIYNDDFKKLVDDYLKEEQE